MLNRQKQAFRAYCKKHRYLYRVFSQWFERRANRAMGENRRQWGIDGDLVVFSAYNMCSYSDNPRYICEALHAMRPRTTLVWIFRDVEAARKRFDIPDYVRCVAWRSPMCYFFLGCARVIVDNWQKSDWLRLGREQVYLFSPHHDRSFKSGGFMNRQRLYGRMVEAHATVMTTGSDFNKRFMRKATHFKGPYLDAGLPRNDILVRDDPEDEIRIRRVLGVDLDVRLLLFAPTYRDADRRGGRRESVALDLTHVLDVLEEATGERWLCLYRAHYLSLGLELEGASNRLIDATAYSEMAELLRVADALISDYSCVAGDFTLRGRPIWLYIADIDEYTRYSRELYVDPRDTPCWCARTPSELDALIRRTTPEMARENCRAVLDYYGTHETGRAAELSAGYICDLLDSPPVKGKGRLKKKDSRDGMD